MLFGVKLQNEVFPPWKNYYIDYDHLKRLLKENVIESTENPTKPGSSSAISAWSEKDEAEFASQLDSELEKVYTFQISKYKELDEEISKLELQSEEYLKSISEKKSADFDAKAFQKKLEELLWLAKELDHFARLNFTGFIKIVKKHDRLHKGYSVKALLSVRMKSLPLNNISEDTSPYLFRISTLYSFVRDQTGSSSLSTSLQNSIQKLSSSGRISTTPSASLNNMGQKDYGYKVLKFWIHPDNLMEIKTTILRHLPVLIYTNQNDDDDDEYSVDPKITSLYFDNRQFELYNNKLLKNLNKTPSLRIRWSGKLRDNPELTIEKKIFDYDTGTSNDVRLSLKEKYINDFIFQKNPKDEQEDMELPNRPKSDSNTKLTLEKFVKRLERRGISKESIDKLSSNFKELQQFIRENDLQPTLRTVHTRTAFQMPGDDRVRITIDSDILFIREDSFDPDRPIRNPREWHRMDIDSTIDDPYSLLRKGEYAKFPYSVMEIKLANSIFNNPSSRTLAWINDLTNGHLVKEVPNFSKFIQGISSLFLEDDNLDILPFWLPELENDIRKNPEQAYHDSREKQIRQQQQDEILKNLKKKVGESPNPVTNTGTVHLDQIVEEEEDLDDNESSDEESATAVSPSGKSISNLVSTSSTPITPGAPSESKSFTEPPRKKKLNVASYFIPVFSKASKLEGYESEDEEIILPPGVVKPKTLIKQSGPVKVEAKVWLANERTFVRWLHITTLLSALTFTIYASVSSSHIPVVATNIAYIYFALTLFSGVWAYAIYMKRLELIKLRSGRHLDGVFGPLVVALVLIFSLCLEYYAGVKKYNEKHSLLTSEGIFTSTNDEVNALHPIAKFSLQKIVSFLDSI
ncbi:hypothetical protein KL918_000310 [Ogataea parapolymorpha]|uniref:Vacuolar membrane protein involved in vacuolar polyphosphate accumulation n=1 Tax=Ogataea parapolymorpha (strain ATCC 26012 / BCRC 20466 / JCM 22074 / NRRL Y-7560 / DL-1) TaxID=871575 RepID=W1Q8M2_OGAPD|nr:Vacuolar membrane protein involved in vacuolar polyphosphate accumulation [Ogataea parapolymorpha DL-1]ESW96356.1 Vacuolar membrane protein involved in vacuolar polyphosphate accumulation [Ogataea parapolymorpha DL-1]KAG7870106.1 hypothetical protein KL918_000310 [Ogataea parapolymorpha]KAG7875055.1 hypothetical protein KL916_000667 [Ogataea parapolymorpha]